MNKFPKKPIKTSKSYAEDYLNTLAKVSKKINFNMINRLSDLLLDYYLSENNYLYAVKRFSEYRIIFFVII